MFFYILEIYWCIFQFGLKKCVDDFHWNFNVFLSFDAKKAQKKPVFRAKSASTILKIMVKPRTQVFSMLLVISTFHRRRTFWWKMLVKGQKMSIMKTANVENTVAVPYLWGIDTFFFWVGIYPINWKSELYLTYEELTHNPQSTINFIVEPFGSCTLPMRNWHSMSQRRISKLC